MPFHDLEHGSWHLRAESPKRWWYQKRPSVGGRRLGFGEGERRRSLPARARVFTRFVRVSTSERSWSSSAEELYVDLLTNATEGPTEGPGVAASTI